MVKRHSPDDVFLFDRDWNQVDSASEQTSDSVAGIFYESVYAFEYSTSNNHAEWDSDLNFLSDRTNSGPGSLRGADIDGYDTGEVYLISEDGDGEVYSFNNSVNFDVSVRITGTNSPVTEGDVLEVTANVTNFENTTRTLSVNLTDTDFSNQQQDETSVTLAPNESTTVVLDWQTDSGDVGTGEVTVATEDGSDSQIVTVEEREVSDECVNRRSLSRGEENQECPRDRTLSRGGSRDDLDRGTTRGGDRSRRDRGRGR
jgi:acyl-CoA hydrolase